jgi:V8-like Glu-specific endopeptidase
MRDAIAIGLACALLASCDQEGGVPYCGDVKAVDRSIINGVDGCDPSVAPLTGAEAEAVGMLELGGTHMCTGAVIAPSTVLTAAHCLRMDPPWVAFHVGRDWTAPTHSYEAASWQMHPGYAVGEVDHDMAIVHLTTDPMADGVAALPVHQSPPQDLVGRDVQAVGYGFTSYDDGSNRNRWWVVLNVERQFDTAYVVSGDGTTGTCVGDSGGPLLWNHPELGVRVFGVLSLGEADTRCLGDSYYTRSDHADNAAFLSPFLPADPCGAETLTGRCEGGTAIYCEDGTVHTDTCVGDETCRADEAGRHRCLPPPGGCEAEGLTFTGTCTPGGHARWCQDGVVMDRDCPLCDQQCGWAGEALGYYCID